MARKKSQSKRGAIELSITTIIVIVIGVVLLGLGIGFVSGIFSDVGGLQEDVFQRTRASIETIDIGGKFSVPNSVEVEEGGATTVDVIVGHDGSLSGEQTFQIFVAPERDPISGVTATVLSTDNRVTLSAGQQARFRIVVEAPPDALAKIGTGTTPKFTVEVKTPDGRKYDSSGFIVKVNRGTSLFG